MRERLDRLIDHYCEALNKPRINWYHIYARERRIVRELKVMRNDVFKKVPKK